MAKQKSFFRHNSDFDGDLCMPDGRLLASISLEDAEAVTQHRWHRVGKYIARSVPTGNGKQSLELLQRFVAKNAGHDITDAVVKLIDGDQTNCTRENLHVRKNKKTKPAAAETPDDRQLELFPTE